MRGLLSNGVNGIVFVLMLLGLLAVSGCEDNGGNATDGDSDYVSEYDAETIEEEAREAGPDESLNPPPRPSDSLGFVPPTRKAEGEAPSEQEIADFTRKVGAFFKETDFINWVYRTNHGLDKSVDASVMDYKLWWQDTTMRREGDTLVFTHVGRAENILKRTLKVMSGAAAGYRLTGDPRMAELATQLMNGVVALSVGMEFEGEKPLVKYLQARAVFNRNHSYTVDGRKVSVDYSPMYWDETHENWYKWNVHVFEIPDNPSYGKIWISSMRSKDDVPYIAMSLPTVVRVYHDTKNEALKQAAKRYLEYMRGFSQDIVNNGWYIRTKYRDGSTDIARDYTKDGHPPADLGSFVHWESLFGPEAECNAQLGTMLTAYGVPGDKGDCGKGSLDTPGWSFEKLAFSSNWFNYNIYNYFHIGALSIAQSWGYSDLASSLMEGLVARFDEIRGNPELPNKDHDEFASDMAGWLISAATHGYPLNAAEARHIMQWYGESSDWYRAWPHWDPWTSLKDGEELSDYQAPRKDELDDGQGGKILKSYMRLDEWPYLFEYCDSPHKDQGVRFIDCTVLADPSKWGK